MINIDIVKQITNSIAAKNQSAFPSPQEWNNYANYATIDLFNSYVDEWRQTLHKNVQGQTLNMPMGLKPFVENEFPITFTDGVGTLPADQSSNLALSSGGKTVKKIDYKTRETYLNSTIDEPTVDFPVYCELNDTLLIYPTTITSGLLTYLRTPVTVKWAYTLNGSIPVYNAGTSVDFEFQQVDSVKLIMRILTYMGIATREGELTQYAELLKKEAA